MPNGPQDFSFTTTGDGLSNFSLDDDADPTLSNSVTFSDLTPGSFSITEAAVPGFATTGLVCDTPNYGAGGDTIVVSLISGDDVTCTFTNTEYGSVTIVKHAVADAPRGPGPGLQLLRFVRVLPTRRRHRPDLSNSQTFGDLLPGQYSVVESLGLPGWALTGLSCTAGATDLNTGVADDRSRRGRRRDVHVHEHAEPGDLDHREGHAAQRAAGLQLHHHRRRPVGLQSRRRRDPTLSNSVTFSDLTPGQFSITEATDPGFALTGLVCDTPNYGASSDTWS